LKVLETTFLLRNYITEIKLKNLKIGFVPTMGALHLGHLSLIEKSNKECDITIASIFVNPTQFNNSTDLEKYPKPIAKDLELLKESGCHAVFNPSVDDIYPKNEVEWTYNIGYLNTLLEGSFRPSHYLGVTQIVNKLFGLVKPDMAFFGQKDYQQYLVIKQLVKDFNLPINVVACPIVREESGLALSSRNIRLNPNELKNATVIYQSLLFLKDKFLKVNTAKLLQQTKDNFGNITGVSLEYLEIRRTETLKPYLDNKPSIALIACKIGEIRLIDNMMLS
jgi:pantoate--beta-alanine ligase